ncbi:MAG: energy-coupling factor transporter transmembrane protein EcfT [Christensenellaceae bacterium]|nr:energy-coupling factor transporter transmembrane protein EcfT [Christensenellaceae bacterium]
MIKNITLGQYFPGNSVIHRLDARIKLLIAIELIVVIFCLNNWGFLLAAGLIFVSCLLSKISVKHLIKGIKPLRFVLLLTFIINVFFIKGETVLLEWWKIVITLEGITKALTIAVRLILLVAASSMLTLTTSPMEITAALESLLKPLKAIKFPVAELALMMSIALRFIPTLMSETDKIMKAQTARGASFDTGNIFEKAKGMVPILIPLFVSAFKRADELALAMESRCYNNIIPRTKYRVMKVKGKDFLALGICSLLILAAVFGL